MPFILIIPLIRQDCCYLQKAYRFTKLYPFLPVNTKCVMSKLDVGAQAVTVFTITEIRLVFSQFGAILLTTIFVTLSSWCWGYLTSRNTGRKVMPPYQMPPNFGRDIKVSLRSKLLVLLQIHAKVSRMLYFIFLS